MKLDQVRLNDWNPKDLNTKEYRKVVESIKRDGQKSPVIVRENNGYEIIDGCQRLTALQELGAKEIIIYNEGKVSDKDAKNQTLWWQLQVPFNSTMLAPLVIELQAHDYVQAANQPMESNWDLEVTSFAEQIVLLLLNQEKETK